MKKPSKHREGFTTGSAVAAAAAAALSILLTGEHLSHVSIPLPPDKNGTFPEQRLGIPISFCERVTGNGAAVGYAGVIKDAGDDPDITNGMLLTVHVAKYPAHFPTYFLETIAAPLFLTDDITLYAGPGIGIVTLPGLAVPVGEMAVNPTPRRQIAAALEETAVAWGYTGPIHCRLAALDGEACAQRTLNPRLGIAGGISILGTQGTVKPFSTEAWKATVDHALDMALRLGCDTVCLTTGRRSEDAMRTLFPDLKPQAVIQAGDHVGHAVKAAADRGFARIHWGCFPGKLLKLGQELAWTHAHASPLSFTLLEEFCVKAGLPGNIIAEAMGMPTVTGALETVRAASKEKHAAVITVMAQKALKSLRSMTGRNDSLPGISLYAFDITGELLATVTE